MCGIEGGAMERRTRRDRVDVPKVFNLDQDYSVVAAWCTQLAVARVVKLTDASDGRTKFRRGCLSGLRRQYF
jgi:hypothetical protein